MIKLNPIGIVQGRLSPRPPGRYQAFPWSSWEREFEHAKRLGLDQIEWVFEADRWTDNPIWSDSGIQRISQLSAESGVTVRSVCADYFMEHPFSRVTSSQRTASIEVLNRLIEQAARLGTNVILLPVLEIAEVRTAAELEDLVRALQACLPVAEEHGVQIGLETELPAKQYRDLIELVDHPLVGAYYDIGNAAGKGYDLAEDVAALHDLLVGVHVKDKPLGGVNVRLGTGAVNFDAVLRALALLGYEGSFVLQSALDDDYLAIADAQARFLRERLSTALQVQAGDGMAE